MVDIVSTFRKMSTKSDQAQGRTFPLAKLQSHPADRVTVLAASSWAMANCFEIEKKLGKLRAAWYVDGRIAKNLRGVNRSTRHRLELFPSGQERVVHAFNGHLWDGAV
jgi:hypothetical protein